MSVNYLGLPNTHARELEDERGGRLLMSRATAGMWLAGMGLTALWTGLTARFDIFALVTAVVSLLVAGCSLALANPRFSVRWFAVPMLLAIGMVAAQSMHYLEAHTGFFLLGPAMFASVFFWRDTRFVITMLMIAVGTFIGIPFAVDGREELARVVMTTPIFLVLVMIVGWLGSETNDMSVEKGRFQTTISSLLVALQERDGYTADHSEETVDLAMAVASHLRMSAEERSVLADVALLHDIGKIGIPNEILNKPYGLDEHEWEFMKKHPEIGERIVAPVPGFSPVAKAIRHEHERWDGLGYPDGICGEDIPLASRVVLVCDAFHAMITNRPYRKSIGVEQARSELVHNAGSQFDPAVVDALLTVIDLNEVPESFGTSSYTGGTNMPKAPQHVAAS